jgi:hypothetical protein
MNTTNETSPTRAADPVSVFIVGALRTPSGSVALSGLENGRLFVSQPECAKSYCLHTGEVKDSAEAQDGKAPVAAALDNGPTDWFQLATELCAEGRITETRRLRAVAAVRQAVGK